MSIFNVFEIAVVVFAALIYACILAVMILGLFALIMDEARHKWQIRRRGKRLDIDERYWGSVPNEYNEQDIFK